MILRSPPFTDDWESLNRTWEGRFKDGMRLRSVFILGKENDTGYLNFYWTSIINDRKMLAVKATYDYASLDLLEAAGKRKAEELKELYSLTK